MTAARDLNAGYGPVLIGMRGSGKSSVAPLLAERLALRAVDADAEIERHAGRPIAQIFAQDGEPAFRRLERELLSNELLPRRGVVLATGGGAVLDPHVRALMRARFTVWLDAPVEILAERIGGSDRPSLTGLAIDEELALVLAQREPLYREAASLIVDTGQASLDEVVAQIARAAQQGAR